MVSIQFVGGVVINSIGAPTTFRPKPELFRSGIIGTVLVSGALFSSLYLVTMGTQWWLAVLAFHILCLLVVGFWFVRYFTTSVLFSGDRLTLRSFPFATQSLALSEVSRLVLAQVYIGATDDTHTHLSALDGEGAQLFRLRTKFWALDDIHQIAELIGAPLTVLPRPVSASELAREFTRH